MEVVGWVWLGLRSKNPARAWQHRTTLPDHASTRFWLRFSALCAACVGFDGICFFIQRQVPQQQVEPQ